MDHELEVLDRGIEPYNRYGHNRGSSQEGDASLNSFDPFDPAQAGRHHAVMADLRSGCPVARLDTGLTVISRYEDVRETLNAPTMRNSNAARAPGVTVPPEDRLFFFEYDPPEHSALRRLVIDLLSKAKAEQKAPAMRAVAEELLRPIVDLGRADLVQDFSVPFGGRLMMQIAGFPESDAPRWRSWITDMVTTGFSFTNRNERGVGFAQCYPEVLDYLDNAVLERMEAADKPDDVLTRVLDAHIDGRPLDRTIQRMILFSVVSAGTNTLVNFASNTLLSLARDPDLLDDLRADRSLIPAAVEESLRRDSPSMYITRLCSDTTEIAGERIQEEEKLLLGLASANRDSTVFPRPDEFRLDRQHQPSHVAFGWGSHLCLGAWIARQAGTTMLDAFVDLAGDIQLEPGQDPVPYLSPQGNGLGQLLVRVSPRLAGSA